MKKISIMLVENQKLIREGWRFMLEKDNDFEVVAETEDTQNAVEMAIEKKPDIILMEISTKPVEVFETVHLLRKFLPLTKIIAVTMYAQYYYVKKMLKAGAKAYVTKNSDFTEMIAAIKEALEGNTFLCEEIKQLFIRQQLDQSQDRSSLNMLSGREIEVANLVTEGFTSKEIAGKLGLSTKTIEVHRHNILKKSKAKNSVSLVNYINANSLFGA